MFVKDLLSEQKGWNICAKNDILSLAVFCNNEKRLFLRRETAAQKILDINFLLLIPPEPGAQVVGTLSRNGCREINPVQGCFFAGVNQA